MGRCGVAGDYTNGAPLYVSSLNRVAGSRQSPSAHRVLYAFIDVQGSSGALRIPRTPLGRPFIASSEPNRHRRARIGPIAV